MAGALVLPGQIPPGATDAGQHAVGSPQEVPEGVADDTNAFALAGATKHVICVQRPPAHYRLTRVTQVQSSVVGSGMPEIRMYGATGRESQIIFKVKDYTRLGPATRGIHLNGQYDGVGAAGEGSHDIEIQGSRNVSVENNLIERPYGDCVCIGGDIGTAPCMNIAVRNNRLVGPHRCNIAVMSAKGVLISGNLLQMSSDYVAAVDLEPHANGVDAVWGVPIRDNTFDVPKQHAVTLYQLPGAADPADLDIVLLKNKGSAGRGFLFQRDRWVRVTQSNNF